jgi:hypothetical protein
MVGGARCGKDRGDFNPVEFDGIRVVTMTIFPTSGKWSGADLDHFVGVNKMVGGSRRSEETGGF